MLLSQCVLVFKCPIEMLRGVCGHALPTEVLYQHYRRGLPTTLQILQLI